MPRVRPPACTLDTVKTISSAIEKDFPDRGSRVTALLYPAGHDEPMLVPVPYVDEVLSTNPWLDHENLCDFYTSAAPSITIRRYTFNEFPGTDLPLPHAYTVFYYTQTAIMPLNKAIVECAGNLPEHMYLRNNVLVLKHQFGLDTFENMLLRDEGLVEEVMRSAISDALLKTLDEEDLTEEDSEESEED